MFSSFYTTIFTRQKLQNFNEAKFNGNDGNNISAMKIVAWWKNSRFKWVE
jgi:hypothetical protein